MEYGGYTIHTVYTLNLIVRTVKLLDLQLIRLRSDVNLETLFIFGLVWPLRTWALNLFYQLVLQFILFQALLSTT